MNPEQLIEAFKGRYSQYEQYGFHFTDQYNGFVIGPSEHSMHIGTEGKTVLHAMVNQYGIKALLDNGSIMIGPYHVFEHSKSLSIT